MSVIDFCKECGGPIYDGETICSNCGAKYLVANVENDSETVSEPESEKVSNTVSNSDALLSTEISVSPKSTTSTESMESTASVQQVSGSTLITTQEVVPGGNGGLKNKWKLGVIGILILILTVLVTIMIKSGKASTYAVIMKDCTWQQAFDECKQAGGHLVIIETEKELKTLTAHIDEQGLGDARLYIAAARNDDSAEYYWIDENNNMKGKMLNGESSFMSDKWENGEPSFDGGDGSVTENRVVFVHKLRGYWKIEDVPDNMLASHPDMSGKTGYIIEYD